MVIKTKKIRMQKREKEKRDRERDKETGGEIEMYRNEETKKRKER